MATQVLIAHTGQRLEIDTAQFSTLDDLKAWVSRKSGISLNHIVALTPQGRSAKFASLHAEKEIYIYDIQISQPESSASNPSLVSRIPLPKRYSGSNAPNSIEDVQAISSWQELYKERRNWAVQLAEDCGSKNSACVTRYDEIDVMIKCLDAAVQNLEISVKQIEPKYNDLKKWVEPALLEHEELAANWQQYVDLARNTPISSAMVKFMTRREFNKTDPSLEDLIELDTANKAGNLASTAKRRFSDKAANLDKAAEKMYQGLQGLISEFDQLMSRSALGHSTESDQLLQDIEAVVKQVDQDYRTALGYSNSQRDLAQASKTASNHTERLVPTLKRRAKEMDDLVQYVTDARNSIASDLVTFMRNITEITSLHSNVRNQINVLNQSEDDMTTFDYLRLIHQLPYMYASFLAETIRRHEWTDKVKTDSSTLANEMALFQDEESKRRRKWQRMVGSMYGPSLDTNVMGLEVNLQGEDTPWPSVDKNELDNFLDALHKQNTDEKILDDVSKLVQELNSPTKQQSKRLKAFKNGSIHEAALGRSGLLIRGDDDLLRSLQDDKSKMESKLKTAESRVRRLEDLLHRQSQASRPGNLFQPQSQPPRERHNSNSSVKSNRQGDRRSSDGADPLLRRIAQLENDLREEKQRSSRFEKDLTSRTTQNDDMKDQIQEVTSTKNDLLENLEALKREFLDERKSFEDEIKALKGRLEDTEDEIEHFGESREHEKSNYDEKLQGLETEVERLNRVRADETLKSQGQVDFLRNEARIQREQLEVSSRQVRTAQDENRATSKALQAAQEAAEAQLQTLSRVHAELNPGQVAPGDGLEIAESLATHLGDLVANVRSKEHTNSLLKTELEQAQASAKMLRIEMDQAKEQLSAQEIVMLHLREELSQEKAKVVTLEGEVNEAREELSKARGQLSDGETGSETMREKLEQEERRVSTLTEELSSRQSQVGGLEEELRLYKEKLESVQQKHTNLLQRYEGRDEKTKDLTQRLYAQNDRLVGLLERTGYAVSRKEGSMTIEKLSRADRSSQNPNDSSDPGSTIRRSLTLNRQAVNESVDLEMLYWMDNGDVSVETDKYTAFMEKIGEFDMDLFADTLYQRIKEAEHKARKWQRESRSYKDRATIMHKDAQEKIAFRHFKEGDLALFLPTRNQQAGAWAAFNVGFPHYFLREQDAHRLRHREWLVARITNVQERVVDLSKSLQPSSDADSMQDENDNPFQLSDGLRWYLIDAQEDKPGAPSTPGMGKSTVAANRVEATASIQMHGVRDKGKNRDSVSSIEGINRTLSKSLESRRSSSGSKKGVPFQISGGMGLLKNSALASETNSLRAAAPDTPIGTSPVQRATLSPGDIGALPRPRSAGQTVEGSNGQGAKTQDAKDKGPQEGGASGSGNTASEQRPSVRREESTDSPNKKSVVWDSLWSIDYTYESPSKK